MVTMVKNLQKETEDDLKIIVSYKANKAMIYLSVFGLFAGMCLQCEKDAKRKTKISMVVSMFMYVVLTIPLCILIHDMRHNRTQIVNRSNNI